MTIVDSYMTNWNEIFFGTLDTSTSLLDKTVLEKNVIRYPFLLNQFTGLAEWHVPQGGMFLWIKALGIRDTTDMIMQHGVNQGILLLPGKEFMTDRSAPCSFLRASFSTASYDDMDKVR